MAEPRLLNGLAKLRGQRPEDRDFMLSSWLRSAAKSIPVEFRDVYYRSQHEVAVYHLEHRCVVVACSVEDENQILGWACGETFAGRSVLHWCYVKNAFRGHGLARAMISDVLGKRLARPVMANQVVWSTLGRKLLGEGWDVQPTLSAHLANGEKRCEE